MGMSPFFGGGMMPFTGGMMPQSMLARAQQNLQPLRCDFLETPKSFELSVDVPGASPHS